MKLNENYPIYVANRPELPNTDLEVTDKYSGETATRTALADPSTIDRAIAAAVEAAAPMARMAAYERRAVLDHCVRRFEERADELARMLRIEAGKPIKDSRGEVTRLIDTFRIAADEEVFIGPMISESEAGRLEDWIAQAKAAGAEVLCGGTRNGSILEATVLKNVPRDQPLCAGEAFGPVAIIDTFSDFDDALRRTNDSAFGIHAGVFTPSLDHAMRAWDELEVGGVLINEIPSWRVDNMPYGGVKDSGLGREGVRYAIEDMSEIRALIIRNPKR